MAKRRGPWSSSEDQKLMTFINEDPTLNWVNISMQVESRSPKQCRERYHQNLKSSLNHSPISQEEGELINDFVRKHGKRWADIARQLDGRSDNAVKNWWNGNQNRTKRAEQRRRAADPVAIDAVIHTRAHSHPVQQQPLPYDRPATHQRNVSGSMQDLVDAAAVHRQDRYHQPPQTYTGSYSAHGQEASCRERFQSPCCQQDHHVREPQSATYAPVCRATAQQHAPAHYAPAHYAPAQQYPTQYVQPPSYQFSPGPPSTGLDSMYYARRPSTYADSPGAESVEHGSAPSLVSDHGSPSVRGSSSHDWPSPTLELPPLLNINGSVGKPIGRAAEPSPETRFSQPGSENEWSAPSKSSPASIQRAYADPRGEKRKLTASAEAAAEAAETIMSLPRANGDKKRKGLGLSDLLN